MDGFSFPGVNLTENANTNIASESNMVLDCDYDNDSVPTIRCQTQAKIEKSKMSWTIDNFSIYQENMINHLRSSTFTNGVNNSIKWQLKMYPDGDGPTSKGYLYVFLELVCSNISELWANYKFTLINCNEDVLAVSKDVRPSLFTVSGEGWGCNLIQRGFLTHNYEDGIEPSLPDNKLTIVCEVAAYIGCVTLTNDTSTSNKAWQFTQPIHSFEEDYGILLKSSEFSDFTLIVGADPEKKKEFIVHKAVLAARSSLFASKFRDSETFSKSSLEIPNEDPTVFEEVLRFIYTGKVNQLKASPLCLLCSAHRFGLDGLKQICENEASFQLSTENAAETLVFAKHYGSDQFKDHVADFFKNHLSEVMNSAAWNNIMSNYSDLFSEILQILLEPPKKRIKLEI